MAEVSESTMVTVWRVTTPSEAKQDLAENRLVAVSTSNPEDPDALVLYEMHVPRGALLATDDPDVFQLHWADAQAWPFQVISL